MSRKSRWGKGIFKAGEGRPKPDHAEPDVAGFTVLNNKVGAAIARVMHTVPNVRVELLPSLIRVHTADRMDVVYDDIAEALGEKPGFFDAAALEDIITEHDGQMVKAADRTIFFAKPEQAKAYIAAETTFTAADRLEDAPATYAAPDHGEDAPATYAAPDPYEDAPATYAAPDHGEDAPATYAAPDPYEDAPAPAAAIPAPDEIPWRSRSTTLPRRPENIRPMPASPTGIAFGDDEEPSWGGGLPGRGGPPGGGGTAAGRRYLKGQCAATVPVGRPFSLIVSIVMAGSPASTLEPFDVPPEGRDVLLVAQAPKLRLLGDERQVVHVPAAGDSRPVMFELRADEPGPRQVSVTAWIGGTWLGELQVEVAAEVDSALGPHRDVLAEVTTEPVDGAVSLVVRYDPVAKAYRFEFRDEDNPDEVTSNLSYDPAPIVERLVADLNDLARGRTGYSAAQTRDYLLNAGAQLWTELVPGRLREQFWERQQRIRQLTILTDRDAVPWELLYPMDPGHDAGFLVEQFPVTRAIFRWRPARRLGLWPARFVLADRSLPEARAEVAAMQRLLDRGHAQSQVISALTPLQELIASGNFGLLHFACHNTYSPAEGSSITLDNVNFTPTLLTTAVINKVLARSAPTVFMNACRSAGLSATYNRLDGWASKFLEAGAGAFIGSLWAVSDGAAREFAQEFYGQFRAGLTLGDAVNKARRAAASQAGDPSWLAYTVYGNSRATVGAQPAGAAQQATP
jgi:CHAT domain/MmoB/DmpM family